MGPIRALIAREWRSAVDTPQGYVVAVAFLLASGLFFGNSLFLQGEASMEGLFSMLPLLFLFLLPALAMRLLAEERRSGTYELLATLPIGELELLAGKYLALLLQISLLLALTLFYPLTLLLLGDPDGGTILAGYLAALLLAAAMGAVALFASALTDNSVVAYVIGFLLLLALLLLDQLALNLTPLWQQRLELFSPLVHYQRLLRGLFTLGDLLHFAAIALLFLAAARFRLAQRQWA